MKRQGLSEGVLLKELAKQVNGGLLDLQESLKGICCLVFSPLSKAAPEPLIPGKDQISKVFRLIETDGLIEPNPSVFLGYANPRAIVAPLWKSARNAFADSILVGRSSTCDIRLNSSRVSKLHAWLTPQRGETDTWKILDNYSTNGTWVDGLRLEPAKEYFLHNNHEVVFGCVACVLLTAKSLEALCGLIETQPVDMTETRLTLRPAKALAIR